MIHVLNPEISHSTIPIFFTNKTPVVDNLYIICYVPSPVLGLAGRGPERGAGHRPRQEGRLQRHQAGDRPHTHRAQTCWL